MKENYRAITIQDLIDFVNSSKSDFPDGLNTVIMTADFESNYLHEKHEICYDCDKSKYGPFIALCYEMHENYDNYSDIDNEDEDEDEDNDD